MISIALIGGTGTGKSTVAAYLRDYHRAVWLDCDAIGHRLLNEPAIQAKLIDRFGQEIMDIGEQEKQTVNRKKLGAVVFSDAKALNALNAIIHPPIMTELRNGQENAEKDGVPLCILDGALLMDVGVRQMVNEVWAITADRDIRIQRLMTGRQIPREKAEQIMQNQITPEAYAEYADRVISTNQGLSGFRKEIDQIIRGIYEKKESIESK